MRLVPLLADSVEAGAVSNTQKILLVAELPRRRSRRHSSRILREWSPKFVRVRGLVVREVAVDHRQMLGERAGRLREPTA